MDSLGYPFLLRRNMQIFRPFESHEDSAKYLDNKRLSKQVIEAEQITMSCIRQMGLVIGKPSWIHHPIIKYIYNNGRPYLPDLINYMHAMDKEWHARGGGRSEKYAHRLDLVTRFVAYHSDKFDSSPLPPYFVGFGLKVSGPEAYDLYKKLLEFKWKQGRE